MAFKLKDLIISLSTENDEDCGGLTARRCLPPSVRVTFCKTVSPPIIILPLCAWTAPRVAGEEPCGWTAGDQAEAAEGADGLTVLKQQLEQALAQGGEPEAAQEPALPRTLAEAEELEKKLQEALEELRRHKAELK